MLCPKRVWMLKLVYVCSGWLVWIYCSAVRIASHYFRRTNSEVSLYFTCFSDRWKFQWGTGSSDCFCEAPCVQHVPVMLGWYGCHSLQWQGSFWDHVLWWVLAFHPQVQMMGLMKLWRRVYCTILQLFQCFPGWWNTSCRLECRSAWQWVLRA